jgi:adenylate cyclase
MGLEIERKFLMKSDSWRQEAKGVRYLQGYLCRDKERTVRIRIIEDRGFLTIKGVSRGPTRQEYEYEIPCDDAREMLAALCEGPLIDKQRYRVPYKDVVWEIDVFAGENRGLILAEVELNDENQSLAKPSWIGEEVTGNPRYYNSNLVVHPFTKW